MTHTDEYKKGYSNGYAAGRKVRPATPVQTEIPARIKRYDMLMAEALKLVFSECRNWTIDDKKITGAQGYVALAKIFVDNIIRKGPVQ